MLKYLFFACITVFIFSCKKKKVPEEIRPIVYPDFSNFTKGNYWIYENYEVDGTGRETKRQDYDSVWIEGDTLIRGNIYYRILTKGMWGVDNQFQRDSLHYIVDHRGERKFSSVDFSSIFFMDYQVFGQTDTSCKREIKMDENEDFVSTPAGNFKTLNLALKISFYPGYYQSDPVVYLYTKYAEKIGMVTEMYGLGFGSLAHSERRLLRYRINKK